MDTSWFLDWTTAGRIGLILMLLFGALLFYFFMTKIGKWADKWAQENTNVCVVCRQRYPKHRNENVCSQNCADIALANHFNRGGSIDRRPPAPTTTKPCGNIGRVFGQEVTCDNPHEDHKGPCTSKIGMVVAWTRYGAETFGKTYVQGALFGDLEGLSLPPGRVVGFSNSESPQHPHP